MKYLLPTLLFLSACSNLAGDPGSVSFNLFATDAEKSAYRRDQEKSAQIHCAAQGFTGEGFNACVKRSVGE